jgi:hypothetical protein
MNAYKCAVSRVAVAALALVLAALCPPLHAQTCTVPGSHATIQVATDDPACATVILSAQTYPESVVLRRSVTIAGPAAGGAVIQGLVLTSGAATVATLRDLRVENGCFPDAVRAAGGARIEGDTLDVVRSAGLPCPATADTIFANGFESGNTGAWSGTTPQRCEQKQGPDLNFWRSECSSCLFPGESCEAEIARKKKNYSNVL